MRTWFDAWKRSRRSLKLFKPPGAPNPKRLAKLFEEHMPEEFAAAKQHIGRRASASGYEFEHRCRKVLRDCGWFVWRSPKSAGPADLLALLKNHPPLLIQCKVSRNLLKEEDRLAVLALAEKVGGVPLVAWKGPRGQGIKWEELDTGSLWDPSSFTLPI